MLDNEITRRSIEAQEKANALKSLELYVNVLDRVHNLNGYMSDADYVDKLDKVILEIKKLRNA